MKKLTIIFVVTTIILTCKASYSQKVDIGEKCPDVKLSNIINYKSNSANLISTLSDRKPLIIDFWFTHCGPCTEFIPYLDSLQKAYNKQFNVLLVTYEKKEEVIAFFKKHDEFSHLAAPIVTLANNEHILRKMFPHVKQPHEVWIDKNGIVVAITSASQVTPQNIDNFINGGALHLPEKRELPIAIANGQLPFLTTDEQYNSGKGKLFYSYIGSSDPKLSGWTSVGYDPAKKEYRIFCQNCDVNRLYMMAFNNPEGQETRVKPQYTNTDKFESNYQTYKNLFCYEIVVKDTSLPKIRKMMQRELDNFFGLKSGIKEEKTPCMVLSRLTKDNNQFISKETSPKNTFQREKDSITLKNIDISFPINNRLYNTVKYRLVNETGYNGRINIVIPNTNDLTQLKEGLNKYGLDLNFEMREEKIIVLEDQD